VPKEVLCNNKNLKNIVTKKSINKKKTDANFHENFHQAIVENLYDYCVFTTDNAGIIQSWNEGAEQLYGYKEKEVLGKNCSITFTLEDQEKKIPETELKDALTKSRTMGERYHIRKNKSLFWASGIVFPMNDEKKAHTGFTKIMRDITEQKEFEERRDEFISTATHELRTPITTMKLFADIVKMKTNKIDSTSLNDSVLGLNNQIDRLIALTNYLLDVSKIQGGTLILEEKPFDINKLIELLFITMKPTSLKHTLIVKTNIKKNVYGDEERISQVLTNLISNAIKYSPKGGKVIIKAKQEKKSIKISVQDFGLGISKNEQHKIFTRFFRADIARKTNITGIGLGLYIARKIINAHRGNMGMTSLKGKGSTFFFTIPDKALIRK
jgi:two-component system sensor histidine kinase VicK